MGSVLGSFGVSPNGVRVAGPPPFGLTQIGLPPIGLSDQLDYVHLDYKKNLLQIFGNFDGGKTMNFWEKGGRTSCQPG